MKIKGKGLFLPFSVVAILSAACIGVLSLTKNQGGANAASKIPATATASINVVSGLAAGKINPRNNGVEYSINISLNQQATAGDFVEYYIENLPANMQTADVYSGGVIIGNATFITRTVSRKYETQVADTSKTTQEKQNLTEGSTNAGIRVTFNENIEKLQNVQFTISNRGFVPYVLADHDYNTTSKVVFGGSDIAAQDLLVSKATEITIVQPSTAVSSGSFYNKNGVISSDSFGFIMDSPVGKELKAGNILTYNLTDSAFRFKNVYTPGQILDAVSSNSTVLAGQEVNANGVYLFDTLKRVRYEVIEHTSEIFKVKLLDDALGGLRYNINTKGVDVVDPAAIDLTNYTVKYSKAVVSIGTEDNPAAIYTRTNAGSFPYSGTKITASDQISVIKSSVFVKYIDENGKEIAKLKTLIDNQDYGTAYNDSGEINIDGYEFVGLDKNSAPQSGKVANISQTIIYSYKKKSQPVVAPEVPKNSTKIETPNTGFGQNSSIFVAVIGVLSIVSLVFFKRKASKVNF